MFYQSKINKRLTSDVVGIEEELGDQNAQLVEVQNKLCAYTTAMGPLWDTSTHHRRPMGMLSTEHLTKLVRGGWLGGLPEHKTYAEEELKRRAIDKLLRQLEKRPSLWQRFWNYLAGEARSMGLMS